MVGSHRITASKEGGEVWTVGGGLGALDAMSMACSQYPGLKAVGSFSLAYCPGAQDRNTRKHTPTDEGAV